ncbi:MAG: glycosyltransferase family 39 protein [Candidatus Erginobacter occultus]|nr:glycosyltransferase family 39 protein [Candidatus Erginobacter occultus]
MRTRFSKFDWTALGLVTVLGVLLFTVWWNFPFYKSFSQGDPYLDANQYLPGRNFAERGFFREYLLAEYATGPEEAYPLWYTHNPPLSEILSGVYYRLGMEDISQQRVAAILWNLLAAWFFYLLAKQLATPRAAVFSLAVYISNPVYIAWSDNLFVNHQWAFALMALYFFLRAAGPGERRTRTFTALSAVFFFLLCYSNYEYVPFVALFFIGAKLLKLREVPWSRIGLLLGAGAAAVLLHQLCVIRAVGMDLWILDKAESLLHRTGLGITPLMEIYRQAPILMWEEHTLLHGSYSLTSFWKNFYCHLENFFGWGWGPTLAAAVIFCRFLLPDGGPGRKQIRRTLLLFFGAAVFWFVVFVQHTADHQWGSTALLFGPFAAFLFGTVLAGIYENLFLRKGTAGKLIGILLAAAIIGGLIAGRISGHRPLREYPGIETLRKCGEVHFVTSAIPTVVSAQTGVPAGWMAGRHPALMFSHARYLVNPGYEVHSKPTLFFSPQHPEHPRFAPFYDDWLSARFEIIEKGDRYTIYNLLEPLDPGELEYIDRGRFREIVDRLPRGRPAELPDPSRRLYHRRPEPETEEKIAAAIVGFLLRLTGRDLEEIAEPDPSPVRALTVNLFTPPGGLAASSRIPERPPESLFRPGPDKYWHVDEGKIGQPAWVTIDLGPDRTEAINFIRTLPREDIPRQSFRTAVIQGSEDGKSWQDLATVIQDRVPLAAQWNGWIFTNETPYRYYRFLVVDGHETNSAFYSLGGLELYRVLEPAE